MTTLTIGHLNAHNESRALRVMLRERCDSFGFDEANRRLTVLRARRRYRVTQAEGGRDPEMRGSTPILTLKQYPSLGAITWQASELVEKSERVAPDRWVTLSAFAHPIGNVAHINVHPNAATANLPLSNNRVRESSELWATVDRLLTFARAEGMLLVLSGDLNSPISDKTPGYSGAHDVIRRHMLTPIVAHIDAIAYDAKLRVTKTHVVERELTGSDHPGIVASFGRRA